MACSVAFAVEAICGQTPCASPTIENVITVVVGGGGDSGGCVDVELLLCGPGHVVAVGLTCCNGSCWR